LFNPLVLDNLLPYIYIIKYIISEVIIRNNTDKLIILLYRLKLSNITKLDTIDYYIIDSSNVDLARRAPKRRYN